MNRLSCCATLACAAGVGVIGTPVLAGGPYEVTVIEAGSISDGVFPGSFPELSDDGRVIYSVLGFGSSRVSLWDAGVRTDLGTAPAVSLVPGISRDGRVQAWWEQPNLFASPNIFRRVGGMNELVGPLEMLGFGTATAVANNGTIAIAVEGRGAIDLYVPGQEVDSIETVSLGPIDAVLGTYGVTSSGVPAFTAAFRIPGVGSQLALLRGETVLVEGPSTGEGPFFSLAPGASVNDAGDVAFVGLRNGAPGSGLFVLEATGGLRVVCEGADCVDPSGNALSINNHGDVAYIDVAGDLKLARAGGPTETIVSRSDDVPGQPGSFEFLLIGARALNNSGEITFSWSAPDSFGIALAAPATGCNDADVAEPFGQLTIFDIIEYLTRWSSGDERADIEGDDDIDIFDIIEFLTQWSGGCP